MKTLLGEIKLPPPPDIEFSFSGGRVLIVDDEADIIEYMGILLREYGFETMGVTDAVDCVRVAESFRPDVICLDLVMPKRTGISIYAALRRHRKLGKVPVIIVSGLTRAGDFAGMSFERITGDLGISMPEGWIEKPFDKKRFVETVGRTIERSGAGSLR